MSGKATVTNGSVPQMDEVTGINERREKSSEV